MVPGVGDVEVTGILAVESYDRSLLLFDGINPALPIIIKEYAIIPIV